jgi:hypothetical protein
VHDRQALLAAATRSGKDRGAKGARCFHFDAGCPSAELHRLAWARLERDGFQGLPPDLHRMAMWHRGANVGLYLTADEIPATDLLARHELTVASRTLDDRRATMGSRAALRVAGVDPDAARDVAIGEVRRLARPWTAHDEATLADAWLDGLACLATARRVPQAPLVRAIRRVSRPLDL